jgi:hypothetical protein
MKLYTIVKPAGAGLCRMSTGTMRLAPCQAKGKDDIIHYNLHKNGLLYIIISEALGGARRKDKLRHDMSSRRGNRAPAGEGRNLPIMIFFSRRNRHDTTT